MEGEARPQVDVFTFGVTSTCSFERRNPTSTRVPSLISTEFLQYGLREGGGTTPSRSVKYGNITRQLSIGQLFSVYALPLLP